MKSTINFIKSSFFICLILALMTLKLSVISYMYIEDGATPFIFFSMMTIIFTIMLPYCSTNKY
jgi:hypothetical protein